MADKKEKERVKEILSRVRSAGGLKPPESQIDRLASWFRTLAKRGWTGVAFLKDAEGARKSFETAWENPMTRQQYMRAFMRYLSGLNDDEYEAEFPGLDRQGLVTLIQSVTGAATKERTWPARTPHRGGTENAFKTPKDSLASIAEALPDDE